MRKTIFGRPRRYCMSVSPNIKGRKEHVIVECPTCKKEWCPKCLRECGYCKVVSKARA